MSIADKIRHWLLPTVELINMLDFTFPPEGFTDESLEAEFRRRAELRPGNVTEGIKTYFYSRKDATPYVLRLVPDYPIIVKGIRPTLEWILVTHHSPCVREAAANVCGQLPETFPMLHAVHETDPDRHVTIAAMAAMDKIKEEINWYTT